MSFQSKVIDPFARAKRDKGLKGRVFFFDIAPLVGKCESLGVDSPLFSAIVLSKNQPFCQGFCWWFPRKKDPWKEWKWKVPLEKGKPTGQLVAPFFGSRSDSSKSRSRQEFEAFVAKVKAGPSCGACVCVSCG